MGVIEIASGLQKRRMIHGESPIPKCEYDPVHPDFHGKIDRTFEMLPYATQDSAIFPVIIA